MKYILVFEYYKWKNIKVIKKVLILSNSDSVSKMVKIVFQKKIILILFKFTMKLFSLTWLYSIQNNKEFLSWIT